jgi:hypothetical protein
VEMQTADNVFKNLFLFIIYLICFVPGVSNPGLVCYKFIFFFFNWSWYNPDSDL